MRFVLQKIVCLVRLLNIRFIPGMMLSEDTRNNCLLKPIIYKKKFIVFYMKG